MSGGFCRGVMSGGFVQGVFVLEPKCAITDTYDVYLYFLSIINTFI